MYTSPHLIARTERFVIDDKQISEEKLDMLLETVKDKKLAVNGTLFAAYTAAAFLWFEQNGLDYAVIETGLGGRLDPTGRINPEISLITSIGLDHTNVLGKTIKDIAAEKAGIIKNAPVILHPQKKEAMREIKRICAQKKVTVTGIEKACISLKKADKNGQRFDYITKEYRLEDIRIRAMGESQVLNAVSAAICANMLDVPIKNDPNRALADGVGSPDRVYTRAAVLGHRRRA